MKRLLSAVAGLVVMAMVAGGLFATPAGAAPVAPDLVGPADGTTLTSNPMLIWDPVAGALKYRVQISTSNTFGTTVVNTTTYNTQYAPPSDLAQTTLYWRVLGIDSSNVEGDWSATWSFVKDAANSPTPIGPTDGQTLVFPDDPLVFSWQPLSGIKNYEIQIDSEDTFTPPLTTTATTPNTSWAATSPQTMDQDFYWRVRGLSPTNVPTLWSDPIKYRSTWTDTAQLQLPADTNDPTVEEVVFQWTPVAGAQYYNLQYSPNSEFTGPNVVTIQNLRPTRYSPANTINNGAYFWRVQAKNAAGGLGPWSSIGKFTRSWPAPALTDPPTPDPPPNCESTNDFSVVELCSPADGTLTTEPTFQWTPVRLASDYTVQIAKDEFFTVGVTGFGTQHTTYSYPNTGSLAAGHYYWRVRPNDEPSNGGIIGLWSGTGQFDYQPGMVTPLSPATGASVSTPVLHWQAKAGDGQYDVTIRRANDTVAESATVSNTYYVPQTLVPADGPFTWSVAKTGGLAPDASLERTFSLVAPTTFVSPNPIVANLGNVYAPVMQWSPTTGADHYVVEAAPPGSAVFATLAGASNLTTAGFAYSGYDLTAGTWQWRVKAYNGVNLLATGDVGTFNILGTLTTQLLAPDFCTAPGCELNDTPTLEWNPIPGVSTYTISFANDVNFTNTSNLPGPISITNATRYTVPQSIVDSQAGQAIYWYVRATSGPEPGSFATDPNTPVRAFRKRSAPASLIAPLDGASGSQYGDQVTFTWQDYLRTNDAATPRNTQEAKQYRIQVSTVADFSTLVDEAVVDQTTYTAGDQTYPDGPLYWRVQAIDGSSNSLTWSTPNRLVTKSSPIPTQEGPADGATVGAVPLLTWAPQDYAAAYDVEVYKNPTPPEQGVVSANRVFSLVNTKITAAIATTALPAGTYGWRIRRKDADGRPGPWSTETNGGLRKFTIAPAAPTLVSPDDGAQVTSNTFLLDWNPVPGATQYRIQTSTVSDFSSTKENITTVMTEWAPVALYADGTYYWRVQSLDSGNNVLGTSEVRTFVKGPLPPPGDLFTAIAPKRILDSRSGTQVGPYSTPWGAATQREVTVAGGSTTVPDTADAVTLNVTVTQTTAVSYLSIWPKGDPKPTVSSLNWDPGWTVPNSVTVKVGDLGKINIYNNLGSANVVVDVVGYYTESTGAGFTSVQPDAHPRLAGWLPGRPVQHAMGRGHHPQGHGGRRQHGAERRRRGRAERDRDADQRGVVPQHLARRSGAAHRLESELGVGLDDPERGHRQGRRPREDQHLQQPGLCTRDRRRGRVLQGRYRQGVPCLVAVPHPRLAAGIPGRPVQHAVGSEHHPQPHRDRADGAERPGERRLGAHEHDGDPDHRHVVPERVADRSDPAHRLESELGVGLDDPERRDRQDRYRWQDQHLQQPRLRARHRRRRGLVRLTDPTRTRQTGAMTMKAVSIDGERVEVVGALDVEHKPTGLVPRRLPAWTRPQIADDLMMDFVVQAPSGVRLRLRSDTTALELDVMLTMLHWSTGDFEGATFDLVVDGELVGQARTKTGTVVHINRRDPNDVSIDPGPATTVRFDALPARSKVIELWLPQGATVELRGLRVDDDAVVEHAPDTRRRWVHYGSSISHCLEADSPKGIWPAVAADLAGVQVINLGLGGQCLLDPFVARSIRDLAPDLISVKVGINIVNTDSLRERTFGPALHGFLDTIRERLPHTPILLVSPIFCPAAEDHPGPTVPDRDGRYVTVPGLDELRATCLTLTKIRAAMSKLVATRRELGDEKLHYLDGLSLFGPDDAGDLPDDLHPNAAGYARMGERFAALAFGADGALAG